MNGLVSPSNVGVAVWLITKYNELDDAYELYQATKSEDAALDVATKISEITAGVAAGYVSGEIFDAVKKTGLDRVFDSLRKDKSWENYIEGQNTKKAVTTFLAGELTDGVIEWGRDYVESTNCLDPLFKLIDNIRNSDFSDNLSAVVSFMLSDFKNGIDNTIKSTFDTFTRYPQRSDPFTLDLDGDGLETVGPNAAHPILFDLGATGVKQSVGWVLPDDGLLALDRNGNGTIDDGAELFGDATRLPDGRKAEDGFAAVASLDTNGDGLVDAHDASWSALRVWQDANQDGVSQPDELRPLAAAGIAGLEVGKKENETVLDNGNALADLGTFRRTDGTEGTTGTVGQLADIDLSVDTFTSQFTDRIPVTAQAAQLPDLKGSGQVRDLQQAASLKSEAGRTLARVLEKYRAATTREAQLGLLDELVQAWSDTSPMATTFTGAYAGHALTVDMQSIESGSADYTHWADILTIMERFNGRTYQAVPAGSDAAS